MFMSTLILLMPFLMMTFLPLALRSFSSDELDQMGVQLEGSEAPSDPHETNCILPRIHVACGIA